MQNDTTKTAMARNREASFTKEIGQHQGTGLEPDCQYGTENDTVCSRTCGQSNDDRRSAMSS